MAPRFDVVGIGNGILDIIAKVRNEEIEDLGLVHGGMALTDEAGQAKIFDVLGGRPVERHAGGSAANTIVGLAQFGGRGAFLCALGNDTAADDYREGFARYGIPLHAARLDGPTATSLILVTPDGERTMNTHLGVAGELRPDDIDPQVIAESAWLYVEGYLLTVPAAREAAFAAMEAAKRAGTWVAVSFSDGFVVEHAGDHLRRAQAVAVRIDEAVKQAGDHHAARAGPVEPGERKRQRNHHQGKERNGEQGTDAGIIQPGP